MQLFCYFGISTEFQPFFGLFCKLWSFLKYCINWTKIDPNSKFEAIIGFKLHYGCIWYSGAKFLEKGLKIKNALTTPHFWSVKYTKFDNFSKKHVSVNSRAYAWRLYCTRLIFLECLIIFRQPYRNYGMFTEFSLISSLVFRSWPFLVVTAALIRIKVTDIVN